MTAVELGPEKWGHTEDGIRWFRQSWVDTYLSKCAEAARLDHYDPLPESNTDASAMGTAAHAGCESMLTHGDFHRAEAAVISEWQRLEASGLRYVKLKDPKACLSHAIRGFSIWHDEVYPQLGTPLMVEGRFEVALDDRVGIRGTMDLVMTGSEQPVAVDWKFPSRAYEPWEKERFAIQPTTYATALVRQGVCEWPVQFDYWVIIRGKPVKFTPTAANRADHKDNNPQLISVTRTEKHEAWLLEQLHQAADLMDATEAGHVKRWPLNDQSWFCSEKWCERWAGCRGRHV